jgi:hypothetical protein
VPAKPFRVDNETFVRPAPHPASPSRSLTATEPRS